MRNFLSRDVHKLPFTPSDWLVIALLGAVALVAFLSLLNSITQTFTIEVPTHGGTYTEGVVGTPRFINPILAISDADRDIVALTFSGLLRVTTDGSLAPDIAQSYTVSDDHKTYTFVLRPDATFHDGTPVTADDVAFTILLAQNPLIKSPKRANWEGVGVTVVDPQTISFTLKEPYAPFLENATLGILPKHIWSTVTPEEFPFSTLNVKPVGSGPYQLANTTMTSAGIPSSMSLTAFSGATHVPYITHMQFNFYSDADALAAALKGTATMAAHSVAPEQFGTNRTINEAVLNRVFGVFFNQNQNDLFADKEVRRALDAALDKNALVSTLIGGYGSAIAGPLPPESVSSPETSTVSADDRLASAASILAKDGWIKGSDGVYTKTVKKSKKRLSFVIATGNAPELKGAALAVTETWKKLGVEVTTQFFEQNDLQQEVIRPRKYDALLFGEVVGRELDLFAFWDSSQRNDPGLNIALYTNTAVDKLLERARTQDDIHDRRATTEAAAKIISDEVAAVFLYSPHFIFVTPQNLKGLTLTTVATPADRFTSVTSWYLATERVWPFFKD